MEDMNTTWPPLNSTENSTTSMNEDGSNPFIMPWYISLLYIVAFVVMVLVASGGNLIVIWIVLAHKRMRTVTNYFLVNLAAADLMITILNTLFNFVYMLYSSWPFGLIYCKLTQFTSICTIAASVFTFMAIAIDRYMAIIHPLKPRMGAGTILGLIVIIWITSIAVALPTLIVAETFTITYLVSGDRTICLLNWPDGPGNSSDLAYNIFLMLVTYFIPLLILGVTYLKVGISLWGSQAIGERIARQEETVRSKRRVVKMMIVVVLIFGVCWLPQNILILLSLTVDGLTQRTYLQHIYMIVYWVAMSNSMYNPIIYCWMNQRFRKGFKYVFQWLPWIHWRPSDAKGLGRGGVSTSVRMSVSENAKYTEANDATSCSVMQTMIERLEER
eukprot:GHVO01000807.1.p1 GENE.GHVO01000807.1~~GHVO01000807.1.p1  ORF type:complete len:387 (+),score=24.43 GHVO01000807.1:235-1395(+)